jgi:hypothetical protein
MKNTKIYIALLISSFFVSCIDVEEKPSEQQFTDFQIEKVEKIIVTDKSSGSENRIKDGKELMEITQFLKDSTHYFPSDQIKSSGQRSTHRIDLIRTADTLTMFLYPTSEPKKIEVGYFDPEKLKIQDSFKEYKRFYIHSSILDLINSVLQ